MVGEAEPEATPGVKLLLEYTEQCSYELIAFQVMARRDIRDDCRQPTYTERIMVWYGDVMTLSLVADEPNMATSLTGDAIAKAPETSRGNLITQ